MATRGVVVDRFGNVVEDDDVLRDGERLRVPVSFMDAATKEVIDDLRRRNPPRPPPSQTDAFEIDDGLAQRIFDARAAYKARISAGMHRHRVALEPDTGDAHKERRSDSAPPSSPPPPHGDLIADAELRRAQAYAQFRQRLNTAGPNRRSSSPSPPSPPASDADTARRQHIERLRHAFRGR